MSREPVGVRSKYAQSVMPCHVQLLSLLPPEKWPPVFTSLHEAFSLHYCDKLPTGMTEFRATVAQVLPMTGAKPDVIASAKKFVDKLVQESLFPILLRGYAQEGLDITLDTLVLATPLSDEKQATGRAVRSTSQPEEVDFGFLDDLDLNDAPPTMAKDPSIVRLREEMHAYVRDVASKWTKARHFFVRRSVVNPSLLLILSSVGVDKATGEKTNLNCAIGRTTLNKLGPDHLLFEGNNVVVESYDHTDGRAYYVRAFHITPGTLVRLFISELMDPKDPNSWKQFNQRRITLDPSVPRGFTVCS